LYKKYITQYTTLHYTDDTWIDGRTVQMHAHIHIHIYTHIPIHIHIHIHIHIQMEWRYRCTHNLPSLSLSLSIFLSPHLHFFTPPSLSQSLHYVTLIFSPTLTFSLHPHRWKDGTDARTTFPHSLTLSLFIFLSPHPHFLTHPHRWKDGTDARTTFKVENITVPALSAKRVMKKDLKQVLFWFLLFCFFAFLLLFMSV